MQLSVMQTLVRLIVLTATTHRCAVIRREHIDIGGQETHPYQLDRNHRSFFVLLPALQAFYDRDKDFTPRCQIMGLRVNVLP
jgi:hypothetical protein